MCIRDRSYEIQSLLLRVLQENTYAPVGGRERTADVRIIAATNEDMQLAIREGRFREDLYHRLNEFEIRQPSLAECPEDILPLAEFFRERHSKELKRETQGFTDDARCRMLAYHWPGNVRELQNRIKRAVLVTENPLLELPDLNTGGHFSNFCSCFSAFRRNDFGVEPLPSLQASGKLFWGAGNNFGRPKTQLAMFA